MTKKVFQFPDFIEELVVDDTLFSRAFEQSTDQQRASLKTCIAHLYNWYGPNKDAASAETRHWRSGLVSRQEVAPVDVAVVVFDGATVSTPRLLAGIVPALSCGVAKVLVARIDADGDWPQPVLTGLELAGLEWVVDGSRQDIERLLAEAVASSASVTVIDLCATPLTVASSSLINVFRPTLEKPAVVWMEDEDSYSLEALAAGHPDLHFSVFGAKCALPAEGFSYGGDHLEACLSAITDVIYTPEARQRYFAEVGCLTIGPGLEGVWIWPALSSDFFLSKKISLTIGA